MPRGEAQFCGIKLHAALVLEVEVEQHEKLARHAMLSVLQISLTRHLETLRKAAQRVEHHHLYVEGRLPFQQCPLQWAFGGEQLLLQLSALCFLLQILLDFGLHQFNAGTARNVQLHNDVSQAVKDRKQHL